MPRLKAMTAWVGLALVLFNVFSAATMALRPMPGMAGMDAGGMEICTAGGPIRDHPGQHPSPECPCCRLMCCAGVAVPDDRSPAPLPSSAWIAFSYDSGSAPQLRPAPAPGGSARAPPAAV